MHHPVSVDLGATLIDTGRRTFYSLRPGTIIFPNHCGALEWRPCLALLEMPQSPPAGSISAPESASCSNRPDIPRPVLPSPSSCRRLPPKCTTILFLGSSLDRHLRPRKPIL